MSKKKIDPMKVRRWAIISAIVLVLGLTAFNIWLAKTVKVEKAIAAKQQEKYTGEAAIGGDFEGIDHLGQPFKFSDSAGKFRLVFFGFTNCPDICPTSITTMSAMQEELGEKSKQMVPIFVSVDPKRDSAEKINDYLSNFHPSLVAVTGTEEQMQKAADVFKVYYSVGQEAQDGSYMVDHSAFLYLISPQGKYLKHFPYDVSKELLIEGVREFL